MALVFGVVLKKKNDMGSLNILYHRSLETELFRVARKLGATSITSRKSDLDDDNCFILTVSGPQIPYMKENCRISVTTTYDYDGNNDIMNVNEMYKWELA